MNNIKKIDIFYSNIDKHYNKIKTGYISIFFIFIFFISFFIVISGDASLYFHETVHIAETLKDFKWIGNEPVGTHGFFFKLIPAILFNIFGVSSIIAVLYNLALATISIILFEKIAIEIFEDKVVVLISIILFSTLYFFIRSTLTYSREIPVVFSVLLFIYVVIKKKNTWFLGVFLLLILDAKEHIFFQFAPGILVYSIYEFLFVERSFKKFFIYNFKLWLFPLLYILLMLFTGIIPLNSFLVKILKLSNMSTASFGRIISAGSVPKHPEVYLNLENDSSKGIIDYIVGYVLGFREYISKTYFAKLFLPRVIGILAVPMILFFSAALEVIKNIKSNNISGKSKEQREQTVLLSFIFVSYFIIYYFRPSHGRYLFPLSPIIILFSLKFFCCIENNKKLFYIILSVFLLIGLFFEIKFYVFKFSIVLISILLLYLTLFKNKKNIILLFLFISGVSGGSALLAMMTLNGAEIQKYIEYGKNEQIDTIFSKIDIGRNVYSNTNNINYARAFMKIKVQETFDARRYPLKKFFPKKEMLKTYYDEPNILYFRYENDEQFLKELNALQIYKLIIYSSNNTEYKFYDEKKIMKLIKQYPELFSLKETMTLKNKNVFIYEVIM